MSTDGRPLIFVSARPEGSHGGYDLWAATRDSEKGPWPEPINLGRAVNSDADENQPHLSDDGLALIFKSNRVGGRWHHMFSTRTSLDNEWSMPQVLTGVSSVLQRYPRYDSGSLLYHISGKISKVALVSWDVSKQQWTNHVFLDPPINFDNTDCLATFHRATNTLHWRSSRPGGTCGLPAG